MSQQQAVEMFGCYFSQLLFICQNDDYVCVKVPVSAWSVSLFNKFYVCTPNRTCRLRTEPIVLVSRTRFVFCASALSTAWRKRSWQRPNTNWTWTRRSSRPACLTRSLQAVNAGPSYRPFWSTRSRTRSGLEEAAALGGRGWVWSEPVPTSPTHPHPPVRCSTSSFSPFFPSLSVCIPSFLFSRTWDFTNALLFLI